MESHLRNSDMLLDMDTGGGEFLLSLGHDPSKTAATEGYRPNVILCNDVLLPLGIDFRQVTDMTDLPFDDQSFDVVINRHGDYDIGELHRVLWPGGLFITQQVGEDNDRELVELLLPGTPRSFPGHNLTDQQTAFVSQGFHILQAEETFRSIRFFDVGALVWFAKVIEWEFIDFSVETCFEQLLKAQQSIDEKGFIEGTIHRYLLVAQK